MLPDAGPRRSETGVFRPLGYTLHVKSVILVSVLMVVVGVPAAARDLNVASYDIDVTLDSDNHRLAGAVALRWHNARDVPTSELWFHLYLNAFASTETTLMHELRRDSPALARRIGDDWGWIRLTRLVLADGPDLLPSLGFERPDDGNEHDFTVARVALPREVMPGSSVALELEFEAQLPRVIMRTGFSGDFHMVGQWFPKLAVFEGSAGWSCHQFHAASEFYADFGRYRVRLTIPRGWVIGATGEQISREPVGTADVVEFVARDVHDFAWATAPPDVMTVLETDFEPGRDVPLEWLERARVRLGLGAAELELPPARLRLLVARCHEPLAPRMVRAARLAMAWFGLHLGPYPYPQLTVVSPPPGAGGAAGMEYPTLITTGADRRALYPPFAWRPGIETLTVHEFGHQYFQSMVANNEAERAWLDEGLVSWAENRCLEDMLADRLAPEIRFARIWVSDRLALSFEKPALLIDRPSWTYRGLADYFLASYTKTALALRTLEGMLGEEVMARAMRAYFTEHRFRHPGPDDLRAVLERLSDQELEWFFDAVIHGDQTPDWAVLEVRHREIGPEQGMSWDDGAWRERDPNGGAPAGEEPRRRRVEVELGRLGECVGPVEVELGWSDGRTERRSWDGSDRWVRWSEVSEHRLDHVIVDPDGIWALETRRADNYWRREAGNENRLWWLGHVLRLAGLAVVPWG